MPKTTNFRKVLRRNVVRGEGNNGTELTANVTNIEFLEVEDTDNSWDGTTFIASEDGDFHFSGATVFAGSITGTLEFYVNGVLDKRLSSVIQNSIQGHFAGKLKLNEGDAVNIRIDVAATLTNSIEPLIRHHIYISKIPSIEVA